MALCHKLFLIIQSHAVFFKKPNNTGSSKVYVDEQSVCGTIEIAFSVEKFIVTVLSLREARAIFVGQGPASNHLRELGDTGMC